MAEEGWASRLLRILELQLLTPALPEASTPFLLRRHVPQSFDFEVSLKGARPRVWRRFLLSTGATFYDLHDAIQRACGWQSCHLFRFCADPFGADVAGMPDLDGFFGDLPIPDARKVRIASWFQPDLPTREREKILYEYDFGDSWWHEVKLLGVVDMDARQKRLLLDGARAFPPEDCGGLDGYRRCATFVKTGKDPEGDAAVDLNGWLRGWHPERFDLAATKKKFDSQPAKKTAAVVVGPPAEGTKREPPGRGENAWCKALGIAVPDVVEVAKRKPTFGPLRIKDLVVVELLAHGAPMTDAEVVESLTAAGLSSGAGDLARSLKRSLAAGMAPLLRDHAGRLTLDFSSQDLDLMLFSLGLRGPRRAPAAPQVTDDIDGPLTPEEVDDAYEGRLHTGDTMASFLCAVLDAERGPMRFADVMARYVAYGGDPGRFQPEGVLRLLAKRRDVVVEAGVDGEVVRFVDDVDLRSMRAAVRKRARSQLEAQKRAARFASWQVTDEQRKQAERAASAKARRVVIACAPRPEAPERIEAFDVASGERKLFEGEEGLATFASWVTSFDVVAGVRPHQTLGAVGTALQGFQKLVDLLPAQKTVTVDGRQRPVTWEGIVEATLGLSGQQQPRLATVFALYRYGLLHGELWTRIGDRAAPLPLDAALPGEQRAAWYALQEAQKSATTVAMWVGTPADVLPAMVQPFHAGVRGRVVELDRDEVVVEDDRGRFRTVSIPLINCLDVTGATDFVWKLPVTETAGS